MPEKVACPRCGQDWLNRVRLRALAMEAILCPECEALWLNEAAVFTPGGGEYGATWFDYSTFMEAHGRMTPHEVDEFEELGPLRTSVSP